MPTFAGRVTGKPAALREILRNREGNFGLEGHHVTRVARDRRSQPHMLMDRSTWRHCKAEEFAGRRFAKPLYG